jgi:hypothetical protein
MVVVSHFGRLSCRLVPTASTLVALPKCEGITIAGGPLAATPLVPVACTVGFSMSFFPDVCTCPGPVVVKLLPKTEVSYAKQLSISACFIMAKRALSFATVAVSYNRLSRSRRYAICSMNSRV